MRFTDFITEANIYNTPEVKQIASDFAKHLPEPYKKQFTKAVYNDIINNPQYHTKLTKLPDGSPEWATQAMDRGDLYQASVNTEKRNQINQILHWLEDIIATSKSSENATDRHDAQQQLNSLSRMTMSQMLDQEQQWFARHQDQIKGETTGMHKILDAGNGYAWWQLDDQTAFEREGRVLANCIGSHYTADNTEKTGETISILKNNQLESVVAMRYKPHTNRMEEVKGKNNRPPIAAYMPYVNVLLEKLNLVPSHNGLNDLRNSGYTWDGQNKTIKHISEQYPFETGPSIGSGLILVKWTAPHNITQSSFSGRNAVWSESAGEYNAFYDRYDVVSPRNPVHPRISLAVKEKRLIGVGNLPNPNHIISKNGMETLANMLENSCRALGISADKSLTGPNNGKKLGLNQYGIQVVDGHFKTDYELAIESSIRGNPRLILNIEDPSERLQLAAVKGDPSAIKLIKNPSELVQIYAFKHITGPVDLLEYLLEKNYKLSEDVQIAAVQRSGYAVQFLPTASKAVERAAVEQDGTSLVYIAHNHRINKMPAPDEDIQLAAAKENILSMTYLMMYYPITPGVQMAVAKMYEDDAVDLLHFKDLLEDHNKLDPRVEKFIDQRVRELKFPV